ncbi:MAG: PKD domain-containing protein [Bacteroidetes bacterium]|nr:MAG: PKD domain-containing protein [Bacteroidota bacterium]
MLKNILFVACVLLATTCVWGRHISGGEVYYEYLGRNSINQSSYRVTLRLFRECSSPGPLLSDEVVVMGVYNKPSGTLNASFRMFMTENGVQTLRLNASLIPCISGDTTVCYQFAEFRGVVTVNDADNGYTLSWSRCCRVDNLINMAQATNVGATYSTEIPGTTQVGLAGNNSPKFVVKDTSLVCINKPFRLNFEALDVDGDSLSYRLVEGYNGSNGTSNVAAPPTQYSTPLNYASPYSGADPLGTNAQISSDGIIAGIGPAMPGRFVIHVLVSEWRNRVLINQHRKDFILKVSNCSFTEASLLPIANCKNFTVFFENNSDDPTIQRYEWDFGVPTSSTDTSTVPTPQFTYPDTGTYIVTLRVFGDQGCSDTATAAVKIYPGLQAGFSNNSFCIVNPIQFIDTSKTRYGTLNFWRWNFGDTSLTSIERNPLHQYTTPAVRTVQLIVGNSYGCRDTLTKSLPFLNVPFIGLPADTIKCRQDTIMLLANVTPTSTVSWQPNSFLLTSTSPTPQVFPPATANYTITVNEGGCIGSKTIQVQVVDSVTLLPLRDTSICRTDIIQFFPQTNATEFQWLPTSLFTNATIKNATALVQDSIQNITLRAIIGSCAATSSFTVKTAPYPFLQVNADTSVCFSDSARLRARFTTNNFRWLPAVGFAGTTAAATTVFPLNTTTLYVASAQGNSFCNKTIFDTVQVTKIPAVRAFAGNDTSGVVGQPIQLQATGGTIYQWFPGVNLSASNIANPVARFNSATESFVYTVRVSTPQGCFAVDTMAIKIFSLSPTILVPSGFTPNADGNNDVLRPIAVGISKLNYFQVFNRLGEMVYQTTTLGQGWNGIYKGVKQPAGTYVYQVSGDDFLNNRIEKKGVVVLIR